MEIDDVLRAIHDAKCALHHLRHIPLELVRHVIAYIVPTWASPDCAWANRFDFDSFEYNVVYTYKKMVNERIHDPPKLYAKMHELCETSFDGMVQLAIELDDVWWLEMQHLPGRDAPEHRHYHWDVLLFLHHVRACLRTHLRAIHTDMFDYLLRGLCRTIDTTGAPLSKGVWWDYRLMNWEKFLDIAPPKCGEETYVATMLRHLIRQNNFLADRLLDTFDAWTSDRRIRFAWYLGVHWTVANGKRRMRTLLIGMYVDDQPLSSLVTSPLDLITY